MKSCLGALLAVWAMALVSCQKSNEPLAMIPADADVMASINVVKIMENAGCKADGNRITLTDGAAAVVNWGKSQAPLLRGIMESGALDLEHVYMVGSSSGSPVFLTAVTDAGALEKILTDNAFNSTESDSWAVWSKDGAPSFLMGEAVVVVTDSRSDAAATAKAVNTLLKGASKKSVADVEWRRECLGRDNAVNLLAELDATGMPVDGTMSVGIKLDGAEASAEIARLDGEGKKMADAAGFMEYFRDVNTGMLKYLNGFDVAVAAFGVKGDFPWQKVADMAGDADPRSRQVMAMVLPYLQSLDGTLMIGAGPRRGLASFMMSDASDFMEYWDVTVAVELKEGDAQKYLAQLETLLKMNPLPGLSVCAEGNTLIATTGAGADGVPSVDASVLKGQSNILAVRLPKEGAVMTGLNASFGVDFRCWADKDVTRATLRLTDTDKPLLETLLGQVM